jgi:hypothetical protein
MASETPIAATPPMIICPSPPTLIIPARAGTVTASAARMIGVERTMIPAIESQLVKVDVNMSLYAVNGLTPLSAMIRPNSTSAPTTAASRRSGPLSRSTSSAR